jgi:shikimate kinase
MNLVLIGYQVAGKTAMGSRLAAQILMADPL